MLIFPLVFDGLYRCFLVFATAEMSHVGELCPVNGNGHHCHLCCKCRQCFHYLSKYTFTCQILQHEQFMQWNNVGRDEIACLSPGFTVRKLKLHLQSVLTLLKDGSRHSWRMLSWQTLAQKRTFLHILKTHVLSALSAVGKLYNLCGLQKGNCDIL